MYVTPQKLNGTIVVDSSFQTLVIDFSPSYRLDLPLHTPEMLSSLSISRISLFNTHYKQQKNKGKSMKESFKVWLKSYQEPNVHLQIILQTSGHYNDDTNA